MYNLVSSLTIFRAVAGPIIFILIVFFQYYFLSLIILLMASTSDFLDGYLARKYDVTSEIGQVFDPISDKVLSLFVILALSIHLQSAFIALLGGLIIAREIAISGLREYSAIKNVSDSTKVTLLDKFKTTTQFIAFTVYFLGLGLNQTLALFLGDFFLFLSMLITLKTGLSYFNNTFRR